MENRTSGWLYVAGALCFIYVLLRAILIPLTFDEIWTISTVVHRSYSDIFTYTELGSNSHILNSLFTRLIHEGEPWLFRLPNVLSFLIYAWFNILLIRKIPNRWMQGMAFILCFCNPFLLEFFSLARGYGLAMAFTAPSLYYLIQYKSRNNTSTSTSTSTLTLTLFFAALAVLSNFVWLNFYLALLPVLVYIEWIKHKKQSGRFWLGLGIPTLLLFAVITGPIIKLRLGNELWYGGKTGLVYDTFTSLILGVLGFKTSDLAAHLVLGALALLLILLFLVHVRHGFSLHHALRSDPFLYLSVFLLLCFGSVIQNVLFHTLFLIERTALVFLLPLVWLILSSCSASMEKKPWQPASAGTLLLSMAAFFNFVHLANFTHSYSWAFDAKSEHVMDYLNQQGEKNQDTIHLDNSWIVDVTLRHVSKENKYPRVKLIREEADSARMAKVDYYYLFDQDRQYAGFSSYKAIPDSFFRDTALYFPEQDLLLLKVRK